MGFKAVRQAVQRRARQEVPITGADAGRPAWGPVVLSAFVMQLSARRPSLQRSVPGLCDRRLSPRCTAVREVLTDGTPAATSVEPGLNKFSKHITQPKSQGASQAMLYATGLREEDMSKPQVGNPS